MVRRTVAPVGPRKPTNDAEAICAAVTRPTMRVVPIKSAERQGALVDHETRDVLVRQQTQLGNTIRAHLAEFGLVYARGIHTADRLLALIGEIPAAARPALDVLAEQLPQTRERIGEVAARITAAQKQDPLARRLDDPRDRPAVLERLCRDHAGRGDLQDGAG